MAKTINGVRQIQALIDKKKLIITEISIRSDLYLEDAGGTDCLPTSTIFEELAQMGYERPFQKLTFYKAFFSLQWKFLIHTITQCLSAKSTAWNEFSSTMVSLIICLATNQRFNLSKYIFDAILGNMSHYKKIYVNPSHTKKIFANMRREGKDFSGRVTPLFETMMVQSTQDEDDNVPTPSNDLPLSGEDSMQLSELMLLCTNFQKQVLDLEKAKDAQAKEIVDLNKRVPRRVESSKDQESLGDHEDASNQGRSIEDIDKDVDTLIQIKVAKPKVVTTAATTTITIRSKARGVIVQEPSEFRTPQESQPSITKDKGKAIMIEPEVPLKRKDQVALDEDLARNLQTQLEAELIEEEKIARKQEEEANIALIES
ncbi:hypothetical protein Tco_1470000 [Tanacetum coccineum]